MKAIYVDDEMLAIKRFSILASEISEIGNVKTFTDPLLALDYCQDNPVDIAFLDIKMPQKNGLELAKEIKSYNSEIRIVFLTAYDHYALDAYDINALGYLTKPYSKERLRDVIIHAQKMIVLPNKDTFVQTIPRFDLFIDGKAVLFPGKKAKELLAILVEANGGEVANGFAISRLWPERDIDESTLTLYRVLKRNLKDVLQKYKLENIIIDNSAKLAMNKTLFECDFYNILNGKCEDINSYNGKFMSEYIWSSDTAIRLENFIKNFGKIY